MDLSALTPQQNPPFTYQDARLEAGKVPMDDYRVRFCHLSSLSCSWLKNPLNEYSWLYADPASAVQSTVVYENDQQLIGAALTAGGVA